MIYVGQVLRSSADALVCQQVVEGKEGCLNAILYLQVYSFDPFGTLLRMRTSRSLVRHGTP